MKTLSVRNSLVVLILLLCLTWRVAASSPNPDLTVGGAIATLKADGNSSPAYGETYNLGATGLRGWIYLSGGYGTNFGPNGLMTDGSRQILVTVASAPGNAVLAVDDVVLGAMAGNSGTVPLFTTDCRKAFGSAITEAEKTGAGTLRVKRWRAGTTSDVNIPMTIMGDYSATAPYNCPKSAAILAAARTKIVSELIGNSSFLNDGFEGAINGLALLAVVAPGDPDYATVQTRLQTYARALASTGPTRQGLDIWTWGYEGLFLAEYYLSTGDTNVLSGIQKFAVTLAQSQSMFGTFGHSPAALRFDGSGRRSCIGYGPVNQAGLPANLAIVMCKKALIVGGQVIDPEIDPAIQRGSDFFASYVNRGSIPYGEHSPSVDNHASNGKDPICAVIYGLQSGRTAETEYFTRMAVAGFNGREYGHTGQGFSFLWGALGANMGGSLAVSEYLKNIRWHLDLERRTDGSFVYDGGEQYGAGSTADGTYLGASSYYDLNPTASYILTYALPLQRLHITGKNALPANTLDATKVANAIAAATYNLDCVGYTITRLIADLSEYDPVVRNYAAIQLAKRSLSSTDLTTLRGMINGADANNRAGACETLGILKDITALPLITQRLDKNIEQDPLVRATAARALRSYPSANMSAQRDPMLTAFVANATDPTAIDWADPLQTGNGVLSLALFGNSVPDGSPGNDIATYTINASKSLLYPAVKAGLKQPDSYPRTGAGTFCNNRLPIADVQALISDMFQVIQYECEVDRMWSASPRASGITTMAKFKIKEGIPLAVDMLEVPEDFGFGAEEYLCAALNALATYGDAARWTLPTLKGYLFTWDPASSQYTTLLNTIASIEIAITAPAQISGSAVANSQVVVTTGSKAITLSGASPRTSVAFTNVTAPSHGTLTGTAPNVIYAPTAGYTGPDHFTFQTVDDQTTSTLGTVSIIVGTAGAGLKGEYFDNPNFSNLKVTRTDAQVNFDWGTGSPDPSVGADTFSARWSGLLLVPETGDYRFSTLNSDGVRLYINGVALIDDFTVQSTNWNDGAPVRLKEGQMVEIQMEYYENTGSAVAKLKWTGPSFAGANGAIIAKEWLFDGTGVANRTPYALSQSVATVKNTPVALTLNGSSGALTYTILNQPTSGTLTGTAPYMTYTPVANYSGTDSFTFLVNNGSGNSSPATVSISILAGQLVTFTWNAAVSGNWSGGANWTGGTAPASSGQLFYNLNFAPSGTYMTTHDLSTGFQLNQVNMAGAVTLAGTNPLTFAANGSLLPQFNQNSANSVTVNPPLNLASMTRFGGSSSGEVILAGVISGTGGLIKANPGILKFIGSQNNTYSGGTVLEGGKLFLYDVQNYAALGTGIVTLNGGVFHLDRVNLMNNVVVNGGSIFLDNGYGNTLSGAITNNSLLKIEAWYASQIISGAISGPGGITLTALYGGRLVLSGTNTYTGPNRVVSGELKCTKGSALGSGSLYISTGAIVNLNYSGSHVISSLNLGEAAMSPGSYGSTASGALNKSDTYFSGTGSVTILPASTTTLSLTGGTTPAAVGTALTFTATVSGNSPSGNVAFYANGTLLGTSALNGSYQASLTTNSLAIGSYDMTARYAGDATDATSTSAALVIEISSSLPSPPTNLLGSPADNSVGLTWTVSAGASGYYVKRSLTSSGPYTVIANLTAANYTDLTVTNGSSYYYVVSAINAAGESADSDPVSVVPSMQASTTTLVSSPATGGSYGDAVTFTATVSVSGTAATGTMIFKDGDTVLGSGSLAFGTATFTTSTLAVANHPVTATYAGDVTYDSSVSVSSSYAVTAKPLTITGVTAANKVYDGTTTATQSGGTISSGLVGSETVAVVPGSLAFASADAGIWSVTVTGYGLGGADAGNYVLSAQPTVPDATITARPVVLSGIRVYDGTATGAADILSITNNLDGANLTLTGSGNLAAKDAGSQAFLWGYATIDRVQSATGSTGAAAATSINVTMPAAPVSGNTLIAVISTRGTSANRVTSITQTGAFWSRATQATNASGTTTEIWHAATQSGTDTAITINQASLRSAAVVLEYSGILPASTVDQTASATGSSTAAATGTTPTNTQANELWLGAIGIADGRRTLKAPYGNSFAMVANPKSGSTSSDAMIYALEKIVNSVGTANSSGTISVSDKWSGAIATFKAASSSTLALAGSAAGNYTLAGANGTLDITPADQTISFGVLASTTNGDAPILLTATSNSGLTVSYSSSDPTVASVSGNTLTILKVGATTISASQSGDGNFKPAVPVPQSLTVNDSPFRTWAQDPAQGLTTAVNDGPLQDPDHDGISNLMEFALGGAPMVSSQAILPNLTMAGATWVFEYDRSDLSLPPATSQVVEYGNNLTGWTPVVIPATSAGAVTITPGDLADHLSVIIPNLGPACFVRLRVSY